MDLIDTHSQGRKPTQMKKKRALRKATAFLKQLSDKHQEFLLCGMNLLVSGVKSGLVLIFFPAISSNG